MSRGQRQRCTVTEVTLDQGTSRTTDFMDNGLGTWASQYKTSLDGIFKMELFGTQLNMTAVPGTSSDTEF